MAKYYKLLAVGCWLLAASCQEGGDAGDLWGQWRLEGHDDMYISFSGTITQFRKNNGQAVFMWATAYSCSVRLPTSRRRTPRW